jgi:hypothetical protein
LGGTFLKNDLDMHDHSLGQLKFSRIPWIFDKDDRYLDKANHYLDRGGQIWLHFCIVMTFLVRECYGSPKKQEFNEFYRSTSVIW